LVYKLDRASLDGYINHLPGSSRSCRFSQGHQLLNGLIDQQSEVANEPTLEGFAFEQVDSFARINLDELLLVFQLKVIVAVLLNVSGFLVQHLADDSAVVGALVGFEINAEVEELLFLFAVFQQAFVNDELRALKGDEDDLPFMVMNVKVGFGIGIKSRMMLDHVGTPRHVTTPDGSIEHLDVVRCDDDRSFLRCESKLFKIRLVHVLVPWRLDQLCINIHEISNAEKTEHVPRIPVNIVTNATVQVRTLERDGNVWIQIPGGDPV